MKAAWAIARRDLVAAFTTPLAWLVIACWTLLTNGVFAFLGLHRVHGTAGVDQPLFVGSLSASIYFLIFLSPAITMNSYATERVQGTMQLLLTVPIRELDLVAGKFLAAFGLLLTLVAATAVQPLVLHFVSAVAIPHLLVGYLGLVLLAAFLAALGTWISLLVDSPVAAYVITFAVIGVLFLLGVGQEGTVIGHLDQALGLARRSGAFFRGQIVLGDLCWFIASTAGFLLLTHAALSARRIHG